MMSLGYLKSLFFHNCCWLPLVWEEAPLRFRYYYYYYRRRRHWLRLPRLPPADPPPAAPNHHPTAPTPAHGGGPRHPAKHRRYHRHYSSIEGAVGPAHSYHRQHWHRHAWCWATIFWTSAARRILAFPADWCRNPPRHKSCSVWP